MTRDKTLLFWVSIMGLGILSLQAWVSTSSSEPSSNRPVPFCGVKSESPPYIWLGSNRPSDTKGLSICGLQPGDNAARVKTQFGNALPVYFPISKLHPEVIDEVVACCNSSAIEYGGIKVFDLQSSFTQAREKLAEKGLTLVEGEPATVNCGRQRLFIYRHFTPGRIGQVILTNGGSAHETEKIVR